MIVIFFSDRSKEISVKIWHFRDCSKN